ncbi:MAG: ATP-dependent endonuclease, partial [Flavobacteriaceae bacterium]|nr:ATP-dependent endonuclease [Flavobacteriaceae bacterium]
MIKDPEKLYNELIQRFPFAPTNRQNTLLKQLANFVLSDNKQELFLIKGYAGTGKTTIISA